MYISLCILANMIKYKFIIKYNKKENISKWSRCYFANCQIYSISTLNISLITKERASKLQCSYIDEKKGGRSEVQDRYIHQLLTFHPVSRDWSGRFLQRQWSSLGAMVTRKVGSERERERDGYLSRSRALGWKLSRSAPQRIREMPAAD